jgi:hypothetical protein
MTPFICVGGKWYYALLTQDGVRRVYRAHDGTLWVYLKGAKHCVGWRSAVTGQPCYNGAKI